MTLLTNSHSINTLTIIWEDSFIRYFLSLRSKYWGFYSFHILTTTMLKMCFNIASQVHYVVSLILFILFICGGPCHLSKSQTVFWGPHVLLSTACLFSYPVMEKVNSSVFVCLFVFNLINIVNIKIRTLNFFSKNYKELFQDQGRENSIILW